MYEELKITRLIESLEGVWEQIPEPRSGKNVQYELADAGMGAFSVFFTQSPSFLSHQRDLKLRKGWSNAQKLFRLRDLPSDNQIRNLLDGVEAQQLNRLYREHFLALEQAEVLAGQRSFANQLLLAMDGTEYFSSKKIHCDQCSQRVLSSGETNYFHSALTPVLVKPGSAQAISVEPEFIVPQDGQEKQDCELNAAKRWLEQHGEFYARRGVTVLGDDLYSRQPFCEALLAQHLHFILVCKPDSHSALYEMVDFLAAQGTLGKREVRHWNGRFAEIANYRFADQLPLRGGPAALNVNWCEVTVTREDTGERLYQNAFVTDFAVRDTTVEALVGDGRARWKIENENNNVLKTKGYHIEHNFGHGREHLASVLLSLNLLAFLFHTILDLVDEQYRALRQALGRRQTFFQDMESLLRYLRFDSWEQLFDFMFHGLELDTS